MLRPDCVNIVLMGWTLWTGGRTTNNFLKYRRSLAADSSIINKSTYFLTIKREFWFRFFFFLFSRTFPNYIGLSSFTLIYSIHFNINSTVHFRMKLQDRSIGRIHHYHKSFNHDRIDFFSFFHISICRIFFRFHKTLLFIKWNSTK